MVFSYSDVSHDYVMHKASEALAAGANFVLLGPRRDDAEGRGPGRGRVRRAHRLGEEPDDARDRRDAERRREAGRRGPPPDALREPRGAARPAVRHARGPRHATTRRSRSARSTSRTSRAARSSTRASTTGTSSSRPSPSATCCCGTAATTTCPFYVPDVHVVVADPLRAGHETRYHPGEANLRMADVIVINKMDSASIEQVNALLETIHRVNPEATLVKANSKVTVDDPRLIAGKRVLVIEDGPTLTHGEMKFGAGVVAARAHGAAEIVDPRPWAIGTIDETFRKYDVGPVLPAMGYSDGQLAEMEKIIDAAEADVVVIGTPIDLRSVIDIRKPAVRVRYDLEVLPGLALAARRARAGPSLTASVPWSASSSPSAATRCCGGARRTRSRTCTAPRDRRPSKIADIAASGWEVVVTHGNGPQVGRILLQQEAAKRFVHPMPLDVCGAAEPGPDRLPVAGHDRRRVLRAGDGAPRRDGPHADPRSARRSRVRRSDEADRSVLRGGRGEQARRVAGMGDAPRPPRRVAARRALTRPLLDRRGAGDPAARRRRRDRDRQRRGRGPRDRGGPATDRTSRAWSTRTSRPRSWLGTSRRRRC